MEIEEIEKLNKAVTVAVYRKSARSKTHYMTVTLKHVDIVNNLNAKKPIIDHKYEITDLGVGQSLIRQWMKKYKIKKYTFIE
jgi:hypothetical protein